MKGKPPDGGKGRILAANQRRRAGGRPWGRYRTQNEKPGEEPEAACRAWRFDPVSLPSGFAMRAWRPHHAGSKDCFQVGPGLPRVWPYRLTPDRSGLAKLGQHRRVYQCGFSIGTGRSIGGAARVRGNLTEGRARSRAPTSGCRAGTPHRPARKVIAPGPLSASPRQRASAEDYPIFARLSGKVSPLFKPIHIRNGLNILDLALGGFLESAGSWTPERPERPETRCRTRRVGP
jgi:hypothetical protein